MLLGVDVAVLQLLAGEQLDKRHHGLLHVHDAALLLVDVRAVHDNPLEALERQGI